MKTILILETHACEYLWYVVKNKIFDKSNVSAIFEKAKDFVFIITSVIWLTLLNFCSKLSEQCLVWKSPSLKRRKNSSLLPYIMVVNLNLYFKGWILRYFKSSKGLEKLHRCWSIRGFNWRKHHPTGFCISKVLILLLVSMETCIVYLLWNQITIAALSYQFY